MEAAFEYLRTGQRVVLPKVEFSDDESSSEQFLLEKSEDQSTLEPEHDQSVVTQAQCDDSSFEEITQNGKKWMSEEAMVAFEKYITTLQEEMILRFELYFSLSQGLTTLISSNCLYIL